ncbi:lactaldehyde dehydrogenase/glycolaldehyde dehydrogenase [Lewinella aquimaris]|uniref:Lactaldehyde dehydrogenase/glycolaldehyde dehydrogenase n=1 Tax=Neolewinella aquimaris TaxID=1835722 RepID=A0A840E5R9_9BACT|nr:aldehyde dehydrogenase [Neolewinella aquimaris]MBB4080531.1 lactaldehyde dehydrogenase/glycolaldehyde dehydrogenase [Neolewinella aquimaris]
MKNFKLYIDGKWTPGSGGTDTITNPANGETVGSVSVATAADVTKALEAARVAQVSWRRMPNKQRADLIRAFSEKIKEHREDLARTIVAEQGKLLKVARFEVDVTSSFLEYACGWARHIEGDIIPSDNPNEQLLIHKVPKGVVVAITAWNFPLALAGRKIGPALVTGNTMVLKPTPAAPLSTMMLCELAKEAGLPDGVLNVVTGGVEAGVALVESPLTNMVTMTGSTPTGQAIARSAAKNLTHVQLELGGKAPCIVFADADLDEAVAGALHSRFDNYGQVCTCNERMYVEEEIYDAFMTKFREAVAKLKVGDPSAEDTDLGPLTEAGVVTNLEELIADSVSQGARITRGGKRPEGKAYARGNFFEATLVEDVTQNMRIVHEELFGPVLPVIKFSGFDQAMEYANDCRYGLAAIVFTKDLAKIMRLPDVLEFGEIYINRGHGELHQGFHNGLKLSGSGGEDGKYGIEQYLEKKTTYLRY